MKHSLETNGIEHQLWLSRCRGGYRLSLGDKVITSVAFAHEGDGSGVLSIEGESLPVRFLIDRDIIHINIGGTTRVIRYVEPLRARSCAFAQTNHLVVRAPMPGIVVATKVSPGQLVYTGTPLMVMEGMKLETIIRSQREGVVERIHFKEGENFERDAVLVSLSEGVS
ncbi:biotin/lipoyl-containing protein [Bradyrhizobium sp. Tv2a-2]|uniref:acetyl-CoA carboxylase biotin carboxyl carrier protein subunit n=1 Tax=Bradyrhizobium sp. Tv2a-2 TaxID=113395 RepID=UPI0003FCDBFB|nr:biotin/lipoyl-containing protein [Bradyrhizobium sp. Tv2a-2]